MHAKMVLVLFGTLFAAQIILFVWQKRHKRSYNAATLFGMLIIPPIWAISAGFTRFLIIWTIYSLVTAVIVRKVHLQSILELKNVIFRRQGNRSIDGHRESCMDTF